MTTPPLIGLTTGRTRSRNGYSLLSIVEAYVQAVSRAGASPVLIPLGLSEAALSALLARLDGVLFTGGGDLDPATYGSQSHPSVDGVDADRDRVELFVLQETLRRRLPFLGVCRGMQLVNVGLGGTLYEDILDQHPGGMRHQFFPEHWRDYLPHTVEVEAESRLHQILEMDTTPVNSLHHQGIRRLASELHVTALAPDGVIEAVELRDYPFGLAVQWHPEWLPEDEAMARLFGSLTEAAQVHSKRTASPQ